ncbi:hypothetical protein LAUMK142_00189 [Mycobacterium pseudokansasii]|uniref:Uncharacterized protein n=1 Tax=Mycobacterium pseudokansasii TaxID=2341080 RepID=A0A498QNW3_9MYCO|nr:hypothetical protein LAUMK142_00189 [Mycobacterium pseudokansasii]
MRNDAVCGVGRRGYGAEHTGATTAADFVIVIMHYQPAVNTATNLLRMVGGPQAAIDATHIEGYRGFLGRGS